MFKFRGVFSKHNSLRVSNNLRLQVAAILTVLFCLLVTVAIALRLEYFNRDLDQNAESTSLILGTALNNQLNQLFTENKATEVNRVLTQYTGLYGLENIFVCDTHFTIKHSNNFEHLGENCLRFIKDPKNATYFEKFDSVDRLSKMDSKNLQFLTSMPLKLKKTEYPEAFVFLDFNLRPMAQKNQRSLLIDTLVLSFYYMSTIYIIWLFFQKKISERLLNLINKTKIFAEDWQTQDSFQNDNSDDEIGQLYKAFEEMAQKIRLLITAVDTHQDNFVITDCNGYIQYANRAVAQTMEYSAEEMIGKKASLFKSGLQTKDFYDELWHVIKSGKVWQSRIYNKSKHGNIIPFSVVICPIFNANNEIKSFVSIQRNITRDLMTEKALLDTQNQAILANKAKSDFLASISHEMRSPLVAIIGASEILNDNIEDPKLLNWVNILTTSCKSLLELINNVLDWSKVESGHFELERRPFTLNTIITELQSICGFLSTKNESCFLIHSEIEENEIFIGDAVRLKQILLNLLNNAIKFTNKGCIELIIKKNTDPHHRGNLFFMVKDNGIGMSPAKLAKLFSPYFQGANSQINQLGTGLGLCITKKLVENMGGEIWVESIENKGSIFYFTLDCPKTNLNLSDLKKRKEFNTITKEFCPILVVDDLAENLNIISHFLTRSNLDHECALGGKECLSKIEQKSYPLIFLDLQMPDIDGFQCIEQIRSHPLSLCKSSYVIALSGYTTNDIIDRTLKKGFTGYLSKPISRKILLEKIDELRNKNAAHFPSATI